MLAQVATAIRGAIIQAKMSLVPVRRGYWGNKIGKVHTVPIKVTGKCGSVLIRLVPAPRGAGIVAARVPKKVLQMAGIEDCYTSSRGSRKTLGNFVKATFNALAKTYGFLTPDLWRQTQYTKSPLQVSGRRVPWACRLYVGRSGDARERGAMQGAAAGQPGRALRARMCELTSGAAARLPLVLPQDFSDILAKPVFAEAKELPVH